MSECNGEAMTSATDDQCDDLTVFLAMLDRFGIHSCISPRRERKGDTNWWSDVPGTRVDVRELCDHDGSNDDAQRIGGYGGFYTTIEFDAEGKFISWGAWE